MVGKPVGGRPIAGQPDRLGELPDLALVHILSHLTFEAAARTCILSKRFNSVWNSVSSLNFSDEPSRNNGKRRFVKFVNAALGLHRRSDLEKFNVKYRYSSRYSDAVDGWIQFALLKRVKSLHLNLFRKKDTNCKYKLPNFLFKDENLVKLVTSCCEFSKVGKVINWPSLRLLSITGAKLNEELIPKILLGCPLLETLDLRKWSTRSEKLKISSTSLRVLRIIEEETPKSLINPEDEYLLEISGPNLVSLEVSGPLYRTIIQLGDLGSLESAVMDFVIRDVKTLKSSFNSKGNHSIAMEVLKGLCHVKTLTLGGWFIKVLSICQKYKISSPRSERRKLTLRIPVIQWGHPGIATLLKSSPWLETLVVKFSCFCKEFGFMCTSEFPNDVNNEHHWKSSSWRPSFRCPLLHLKTVKIEGLEAAKGGMQPLFQFLEFMLRNSSQLQGLVIQRSQYVMQEMLEEALKLLSVPKASPDAIVHFEPPQLWVDPLSACH